MPTYREQTTWRERYTHKRAHFLTGRIRTDEAAPSLIDQPAPGLSSGRGRLPNQLPPTPQGKAPSLLKILYKRMLRRLSSLPLAIGEMFVIAGLSAVGTFVEQNKPIQYYIDNYPDAEQKARLHPAPSGRSSTCANIAA